MLGLRQQLIALLNTIIPFTALQFSDHLEDDVDDANSQTPKLWHQYRVSTPERRALIGDVGSLKRARLSGESSESSLTSPERGRVTMARASLTSTFSVTTPWRVWPPPVSPLRRMNKGRCSLVSSSTRRCLGC